MRVVANLRATIRRFFELVRPYQATFYTVLLLIAIYEIATISERWLFKILVDRGTEYVAGTLPLDSFTHICIILGLIFLGILAVSIFSKWFHLHLVNVLESKVITNLKRKFFNHIVGLSHNFHTTHKTGSLISRLTRGARAVERMMDVIFFNYTGTIVRFVAVFVSLLFIKWEYALLITLIGGAYVLYSLHIQRRQYPMALRFNDTEDIEKANIGDFLTNVDAIKYYGKETDIKARYATLSDRTQRDMRRAWSLWPRLDGIQMGIILLGLGLLVAMSVRDLIAGAITIGGLAFVYSAYTTLGQPLNRLVQGLRDFYQSAADLESLYQYDLIRNDIVDRPGSGPARITEGTIAFENVGFSYNTRRILNGFSLRIRKDEKVALVGRSGSGKSTLIKLLYRLYDVQDGSISVDGVDIRTLQQESLRSELSIVPQECVLFDDTIYNNVAFSRPEATRTEVLEAMRLARLDDIVAVFPSKENTIVGERGVRLSGGEKQRVSIARALLADKRILVLDEATSSLDSETEHAIQESLKTLLKGRTSIIIAHRLSTIMQADRIIVLDRGKIVQEGKHRTLVKKKGLYRTLWQLQKGGYL